jgi:hypothetical protein
LHGGLYEFTRLALDLVELLDDSGKVIRFPIPLGAVPLRVPRACQVQPWYAIPP